MYVLSTSVTALRFRNIVSYNKTISSSFSSYFFFKMYLTLNGSFFVYNRIFGFDSTVLFIYDSKFWPGFMNSESYALQTDKTIYICIFESVYEVNGWKQFTMWVLEFELFGNLYSLDLISHNTVNSIALNLIKFYFIQ